jgi:hypothetical protein
VVVGHGIIQIETSTGHGSALAPATPGYFNLQTNEGAQMFRNYMCFLGTSRVSIRREVLAKILPIPETLAVEADEFMSAISVAHGGAVLLADSLTYYRLHDHNLYQFRTDDPARMRRKSNALASLAEELPKRLAATGVSPQAIAIIVEPIRVMVTRMRLMLDGGKPWETYCIERADFRLSYRETSPGYRIYKQCSLLLALAMPPRIFYQLRGWYAVNNLRRFRRWLGEPIPAALVREQAVNEARRADGGA